MSRVVEPDTAPSVVGASQQLLVLVPIRLALGVGGLGAALALSSRHGAIALAFALGTFAAAVVLAADRRFALRALEQPVPLPRDAHIVSLAEAAASGVLPSTVGVSVLAAIALAVNRTLAGLLAGVVAGMGLAGLTAWYRVAAVERAGRARLYVERGGRKRLFSTAAR